MKEVDGRISHGDVRKRIFARPLGASVPVSRFGISTTGIGHGGDDDELVERSLTRFYRDWISSVQKTGIRPSRERGVPIGMAVEPDRLVLWMRTKTADGDAHAEHGTIRSESDGEIESIRTGGTLLGTGAMMTLSDRSWNNARRSMPYVGHSDPSTWAGIPTEELIRETPLMGAGLYTIMAVAMGAQNVFGIILGFLSSLVVFHLAIKLLMRGTVPTPETAKALGGIRSEPRAPALVADPLDEMTKRIGPDFAGRIDRAAASCRLTLDISRDRTELCETADRMRGHMTSMIERHDRMMQLAGPDGTDVEPLIVGLEALAREADESRMSLLRAEGDALLTEVRYLSMRSPGTDELDLDHRKPA